MISKDGLAAVYGSQELSDSVQAKIDWVFEGAGELPYAKVGGAAGGPNASRVKRDARKRVEDAIDGLAAGGRIAPENEPAGVSAGAGSAGSWGRFDAFVAETGQTLREVANLQAAITYMRQLEGEKHLVYMSPGGRNLNPWLPPSQRETPPGLHLNRVEDYQEISPRPRRTKAFGAGVVVEAAV